MYMSQFLEKLHKSYSILNESNANENYTKIYKALHDDHGFRPGNSSENKSIDLNSSGYNLLPIIRQMTGNDNFVYPADINDTWPDGTDLRQLASYASKTILPMAQQASSPDEAPVDDEDMDQNPVPDESPVDDEDMDQNPAQDEAPDEAPVDDEVMDQDPAPDEPSRTRKTLNALSKAGKGIFNTAKGAPGYIQNLRKGLGRTADEWEKSNYTQGWDNLQRAARGKKPGYNLRPSTDNTDQWEDWVQRKWNTTSNQLKTMYGSFENFDKIKREEARDNRRSQ